MESFTKYILWVFGVGIFVLTSFFSSVVTALQDNNSSSPAYRCDSLTARPTENEREFEFVARHTATGGAYLSNITVDFGDGYETEPTSPAQNAPRHRYDGPGAYRATAILSFNVPDDSRTYEKESYCPAVVIPVD